MKLPVWKIFPGLVTAILVVQAQAATPGFTGRTWHVIEEDYATMVAVGVDTRETGPVRSVVVATFFAEPRQGMRDFSRHDYEIRHWELDCKTQGRQRPTGDYSYRLGQAAELSRDTEVGQWNAPNRSWETVSKQWTLGCKAGSAGDPLPPAQGYEDVVVAYRQRLADELRTDAGRVVAEREARWAPIVANAARDVIPETSLAVAGSSPHWHGGRLASGLVLAWDRHGIKPGNGPGTKRMNHAYFPLVTQPHWDAATPDRPPMDFVVGYSEFDCTVPNRGRPLALAGYAMFGDSARPTSARRTPDSSWGQVAITHFWNVACGDDPEAGAFSGKATFEQMWQARG